MKIALFSLGLLCSLNLIAQEVYRPSSVYFQASSTKKIASDVTIDGENHWVQSKEIMLSSSEIPACKKGCLAVIKTGKITFSDFVLTLNDKPIAYIDSNDPDNILPAESFKITFESNWLGKKAFTTHLNLDHLKNANHPYGLRPQVEICSKNPKACEIR